jgi:hypothetical protein
MFHQPPPPYLQQFHQSCVSKKHYYVGNSAHPSVTTTINEMVGHRLFWELNYSVAGAQATGPNIHYISPIRIVHNTIEERKMPQGSIEKQHPTEEDVFDILYDPDILKQEGLELAQLQERSLSAR